MRTVLITLIGPQRTADLVVDANTTLADLLPSLLSAGGVPQSAAAQDGWGVALMGREPVEPGQTLEQAGVLDGAVLVLRRSAEGPAWPIAPPAISGVSAGSPLQRTRALLSQGAAESGWRARVLPRRVIPSPCNPAAMARADRTTYSRVIGNLQRLADVLLIDCGTGLGQPGV